MLDNFYDIDNIFLVWSGLGDQKECTEITAKVDKEERKKKLMGLEEIWTLVDEWNDNTACCLSLPRVLPSMRTKPIPFPQMNF